MKYRIVEKFNPNIGRDLYYIQYKNFNEVWAYNKDLPPQETFQEALVLLQNYLKPPKVMYEVEI